MKDFAGDTDGLQSALRMLVARTRTSGTLPPEQAACPLPEQIPGAGLGEHAALSALSAGARRLRYAMRRAAEARGP